MAAFCRFATDQEGIQKMLKCAEKKEWKVSCTPEHSEKVGYDYIGNKGYIYIRLGTPEKRDVEGMR